MGRHSKGKGHQKTWLISGLHGLLMLFGHYTARPSPYCHRQQSKRKLESLALEHAPGFFLWLLLQTTLEKIY